MGRAPAYIFVVRHGNRLDAANKQWHLQSPTPYDPPLTYSGWTQSRALGTRIAEILREREIEDHITSQKSSSKRHKRRRYKVVIHSSPFLRCVQTSIGVSAGLASIPAYHPDDDVPQRSNHAQPTQSPSPRPAASPRIRPTIITQLPSSLSSSLNVPAHHTTSHNTYLGTNENAPAIHKSVLRLDAFLGEWLTPGYFELITPPPGSGLMIASAKAELLRREDYNNYPHFNAHTHHVHSNSGSGQMWGSPLSPHHSGSRASSDAPGLENLSSMAGALPRSGSIASNASESSPIGTQRARSPPGGYVAPVPAYAISRSAEIPKGYVPHARDNCCEIDYQWDSMRGSMDWGDGGQYGEEWTEMHRRFRRGLQSLVDWYSTVDNPTDMVTKERRSKDGGPRDDDECAVEDDDDEEVESVVILVSHGAGCNALIGAITHQPVLMDVGLASLTMAVRKPEIEGDVNSKRLGQNSKDASSEFKDGNVPVHQYYDLEIFANTDHLYSQTPTPSRSASITTVNRGRHSNTFSSPLAGVFSSYGDGAGSRSSSAAANLGSMRRASGPSALAGRILWNNSGTAGGITVGSGVTSFTRPSDTPRSPSLGLWSPLQKSEESIEDEEDSFLPNFGNSNPTGNTTNGSHTEEDLVSPSDRISPFPDVVTPPVEKEEIKPTTPGIPQLGSGAGGLWGSPRPPGEAERLRDMSSTKRRWTVNERA